MRKRPSTKPSQRVRDRIHKMFSSMREYDAEEGEETLISPTSETPESESLAENEHTKAHAKGGGSDFRGCGRYVLFSLLLLVAVSLPAHLVSALSFVKTQTQEVTFKEGPANITTKDVAFRKEPTNITTNKDITSKDILLKGQGDYKIYSQSSSENIKTLQKLNFQNGTGIMLNIHITHHAGTTFCAVFKNLGAPDFACMGIKDDLTEKDAEEWNEKVKFQRHHKPWSYNDTSRNIEIVRKHYRLLSWELGRAPRPPLSVTNWEDPNLVSVIIMRDPLTRLLSDYEHIVNEHFDLDEYFSNHSYEQWWWYAHSTHYTDNFALQKLTDHPFDYLQSSKMKDFDLEKSKLDKDIEDPRDMLESAQKLVQRFTYVLDIACLSEGMQALAEELGIQINDKKELIGEKETIAKSHSTTNSIPYDDIADFLKYRNRVDIELYEWSKNISLVKC